MGKLLSVSAVQEGDDLSAAASGEGSEGGGRGAVGDALLDGPQNGLVVEVVLVHIHEGVLSGGGLGGTGSTPQEGDHGGAVALAVGVEVGSIHTVGDALFNGPKDGINVEAAFGDIGEGILPRLAAALAGSALPVVAQSIGVVGNIAVTAFAGVGGIAALGTGGSGDYSGVAVLVGLLRLQRQGKLFLGIAAVTLAVVVGYGGQGDGNLGALRQGHTGSVPAAPVELGVLDGVPPLTGGGIIEGGEQLLQLPLEVYLVGVCVGDPESGGTSTPDQGEALLGQPGGVPTVESIPVGEVGLLRWSNCDGQGWETVGDPDNASYLFSKYLADYTPAQIGYALMDLDGNGSDELLIAPPGPVGERWDLRPVCRHRREDRPCGICRRAGQLHTCRKRYH